MDEENQLPSYLSSLESSELQRSNQPQNPKHLSTISVIEMSRYHNPIHSPVFPSQISSYSSLSGALTPAPSQFTNPYRHRLPQTVAKTSGSPVMYPIAFDYINYSKQGVSIVDFSARSANVLAQMVAGGSDLVLSGTNVQQINIRITVRTWILMIVKSVYRHLRPVAWL
jgi:hypothetical protein